MRKAMSCSNFSQVRNKGVAVVLLLALLSGCTSIPLGTMWKMRNFGASDLAKVQPQQVRVAGKIGPAPMVINPEKSRLKLVLTPKAEGAKDVEYDFGLRTATVYDPRLIPGPGQRWQVFEFDDKGLAAWKRLKPELAGLKKNYQGAKFSFEFKTDGKPPAGTDAAVISAKLQLGFDQDPLLLLDHLRIPYDKS